MTRREPRRLAAIVVCALAVAGCGAATKAASPVKESTTQTSSLPAAGVPVTSSIPVQPPAVAELPAAEHPRSSDFPPVAGRSLAQLAKLAKQNAEVGPSVGVFTPGIRRYAFAVIDRQERYVYAPTAVYLATSPTARAEGPFIAPADPLAVAPRYRSLQNEGPGDLQAVYWTAVRLPSARVYDVLALSRAGTRLIASSGEIAVAASTPIPGVGARPPAIATETLSSVHGNVGLLTTRMPPESMHSVSFAQVLGKRPIALLFSTPELCTSRVCGPVTDIMVELQHQFANRMTFIHQEVYVNNQPTKGLRPQLKAFHLETEPWLFVINRSGVITARLEGAFGVEEARQAIESALRGS